MAWRTLGTAAAAPSGGHDGDCDHPTTEDALTMMPRGHGGRRQVPVDVGQVATMVMVVATVRKADAVPDPGATGATTTGQSTRSSRQMSGRQ